MVNVMMFLLFEIGNGQGDDGGPPFSFSATLRTAIIVCYYFKALRIITINCDL